MATAIEYGLIAALISVAVIGGATQLATSANTTFTTIEEAEKPSVRKLIPISPDQEGFLGFDVADSPMIIRNKDGSFRFSCPRNTGPVADLDTLHPGDGYCAAFEMPVATREAITPSN